MPLTREQLHSVKRLLKEARALTADAQGVFRGAVKADTSDTDAGDRLREISRSISDEIEFIETLLQRCLE
jgi:hypothetical protein